VLKALWEEEHDTGDPDVLAVLIEEIGLDAAPLLALGGEHRWAEQRALDTQAALARGVFGAPAYVVGEEIYWGQDRLDFLERRLALG
jgi:carboxymethylenebutenolidase